MRTNRVRSWLALCAGVSIALGNGAAWGHDGLSALVNWGGFGPAAPCQLLVAEAAEYCASAAMQARATCFDAQLTGERCDTVATDAAVRAARLRALDTIEGSCNEEDAAILQAGGVGGLLQDAIRACRAVENAGVAAAFAPSLDDVSFEVVPGATGACVRATADRSVRLVRFAVRAWRDAFDAIASLDLSIAQKEDLVTQAAQRIRHAQALLAPEVQASCAREEFVGAYRQSPDTLLAGLAQSARCFAGNAYRQAAVTCAQSTTGIGQGTACANGSAGAYPCHNVDLLAVLPLNAIGGGDGNDLWGWTDPLTGREYALMGRSSGTSFVDVGDPTQPVYLGNLPTHTSNSPWRDIKSYQNYALIVNEASGHGMQVFDLTQLRDVTAPPLTFTNAAHYGGFSNAHNIAINEDSGYAYAVGTNTCGGGLHMVDVRNPLDPTFAGCFSADGYTHDTQCVIYAGPDSAYAGREICFNANEDTLTIVDVTNKNGPLLLSRTGYAGWAYTHQNWLTEDHRYLLMNDELDEIENRHNTRTLIWDVANLDAPSLIGQYIGSSRSTDHNLYVHGGYAYEANYRSGLHVLDLDDVAGASLSEAAFFDVDPASDSVGFSGAWSVYPFFSSGVVIVSGIEQGLFVLQPHLDPAMPDPTPAPIPPSVLCAPTPIQDLCRKANKSTLLIKDKSNDDKDQLLWKWMQGEATSQAEFGEPTTTTDYSLCLYGSGAAGLVAEASVSAAGGNWTALGTKGFKYKDPAALEGGVRTILLKGSDKDKSKILMKGKGLNLPDPALGSLLLPVTAQLVNSETGVCWESTYGSADIVRHEPEYFKASATE